MNNRYIYYWYTHLEPTVLATSKIIEETIISHNWNLFERFYKLYNNNPIFKNVVFFPDTIWDSELNKHIPLTEENFNLIEFTEHECG